MSDTSINYKKFDFVPGMRPLVGEYQKTIIAVVGTGSAGKSTICNVLWNKGVNYISTDGICISTAHGIQPVRDFLAMYGDSSFRHLDVIAKIISEECCEEYVDYFFTKYIVENENMNILLEGYLFTFKNVYDLFIEKCEAKGYRVWKMEREI